MADGMSDGVRAWLTKIELKLDKATDKIAEVSTSVSMLVTEMRHVQKRDDQQCDRIKTLELKVDDLENKEHEHVGERRFIRILVAGVGIIATVAVPIIMYMTLKYQLSK